MATTVIEPPRKQFWTPAAWFGVLMLVCYAPVLKVLWANWNQNPDMGHGFFVPVIAGFIVWQRRDELAALKSPPSWWGLAVVVLGMAISLVATLGVEVFLGRAAMIVTLTGAVWLLFGTAVVKRVAFPLFLLLFMIPIPEIIYNRLTFPLQQVASSFAEHTLTLLSVPVLREGNILELPNQRLSVVEACSGIRSLLSLTFLSLIYAYFFEKRNAIRVLLFAATIPIAIVANGLRVTLTGVLSQIKPALAEGFFHESTGWVIFMIALVILILLHQAIRRVVPQRAGV
ncbi:MAG: exosortase [Acidobacteriia bacterium]|nr:exosortase [Terriglobia bacterium]